VPLKIYTYLLTGKPIIATNLTAHSLVLTDETAVLVDPAPAAFAAGVIKLIENPDLREQISVQARRLAEEKYSQTAYLTKLEKIYSVFQPSKLPREQALHSLDR
jgi:glycosyltransferase involved in cell wall biosynthesis